MITVGNKAKGAVGVYIGRPSALGNPFVIGRDGSREQVIDAYRDWLLHHLEGAKPTPATQEYARVFELARKGDITLVCWCAPKACHGDVIKAFIDEQLEYEAFEYAAEYTIKLQKDART